MRRTSLTMAFLIPIFFASCGDPGKKQNRLHVDDTASQEDRRRRGYDDHITPGGSEGDPDAPGVDDTGGQATTGDYHRVQTIFHGSGSNPLWSSGTCLPPTQASATLSSDRRLRVRVVPRTLGTSFRGNEDDCGDVCSEVMYNFGKMDITIGIKKSNDPNWSQRYTFSEVALNGASDIRDFNIPGGVQGTVILGILDVRSDRNCRAYIDQGYNSQNYPYWNRYCSSTGMDIVSIPSVKCVKVEIQVVTDFTPNFP